MKTIGMLGGMSWESTASYYKALNEGINQQLGGLHSAKIVMFSVDFDEIEKLQHRDDWKGAANILADAAVNVEKAGADFLLICTNTMHNVYDDIVDKTALPILHIADATAEQLTIDGVKTIGLLGTGFTMQQDFYKGRLRDKYNINVIVPSASEQKMVHKVIYDELCKGKIIADSKLAYLAVIDKLFEQGAEAIILGCTEIALLINQSDTNITLYDTTTIHAKAAVELALNN
ncbi:aspartate/glutamate racemase family protein [Shewanella sp. KT0246]|uniref:aspartate/glutamate racemase family protein n=1 Tax=Shewanella sp. KT0246 TaxID=2815912 RepID=UPI001BC19161|nr:aspartate/glutamate racemase family protein [Shewanella sp. KT0246]GIU53235.1 aspartate racemase [Shewanella sp. KT0246]